MKRILALILALTLALSMTVLVSAADETEITLDADHVGQSSAGGAETVTIGDNSVTADEIALFSLILPEKVPLGDTVVIHIKGTSDSDFRVWLLADGKTDEKGVEITFSNQWKASDNGFNAPGEFEKYIELTAEDYDAQNMTIADRVAFKGASFGVNLSNTTLTYVGVIYGSMADIEADAVAEAQPYADAAAAALAAAQAANGDADALNAALADAQAAVDALAEKAELGFPGVTSMLNDAKAAVREINNLLSSAAGEEVLASIQSDIDAVNSALADAKAAGDDIDALNAALASAKDAAARIEAANSGDYAEVAEAAKAANDAVNEIEGLVKTAENAKKAAEEAEKKAEEEAAEKKKQTSMIVTIIVVVVVVVVVIAGVVVAALKKKKK